MNILKKFQEKKVIYVEFAEIIRVIREEYSPEIAINIETSSNPFFIMDKCTLTTDGVYDAYDRLTVDKVTRGERDERGLFCFLQELCYNDKLPVATYIVSKGI